MPEQTSQHTGIRTEAAQRVLAAARELFGERGFDGVSIRDIAARAQVSKANVFHHFSSKAHLYDAVLQDSRMTFDEILNELADDSVTLGERLERFARKHLERMLEDPSSVNLFLRQMLNQRGNVQRERAEETLGDGLGEMLALLEPALSERGRRDDTAALTVALALVGSTFMYFELRNVLPRLQTPGSDCDPDTYCAALTALLRPGLEPPEPPRER